MLRGHPTMGSYRKPGRKLLRQLKLLYFHFCLFKLLPSYTHRPYFTIKFMCNCIRSENNFPTNYSCAKIRYATPRHTNDPGGFVISQVLRNFDDVCFRHAPGYIRRRKYPEAHVIYRDECVERLVRISIRQNTL